MELGKYQPFWQAAKEHELVVISVAGANGESIFRAVKESSGMARFLLFGDQEKMDQLSHSFGLTQNQIELIPCRGDEEAAKRAVLAVRDGKAQILLKAGVSTSKLMRAALDDKAGLRVPGKLMSHVALFDVPTYDRILFITDGGLNIAPSLTEKAQILQNAIDTAAGLLQEAPRAAILTASEAVSPKMPATVDAKQLVKWAEDGRIKGGVVEGPYALDIAVSKDAACHKGISGDVPGNVDILLVPSIEAGNILGKSLIYFAGATMAGMVVGGQAPILITSRADTFKAKLTSIACGILAL